MALRVGVIGCGFIARYHALMLSMAEQDNAIVVVHDHDPARAEAFAAEHGAAVASTPAELCAACDVVFVCTWTASHLEGVRAALEAGLPVFCEKPLATDLASAAELVAEVDAAGVPNQVGLVLRSAPAMLAVRELLAEPGAGPVMNVSFRDDQYLPTQGMYASTWRGDPQLAGSGTLLEHSIHDVDLLEWLLGPAESVSALEQHVHGLAGIEDSVSALVRFASGATATLASIWHDVLSRPSQRHIELFCQHAVITVEGEFFGPVRCQTSDAELVLEGQELLAWLSDRGVQVHSAEQQFLRAIGAAIDGAPPASPGPDVHDALRAHVVVDALYRSARAGGAPVSVAAGAA